MEIKYFKDTDTVLVKFNDNEIVDTRDLNDYMLAEFDKDGNIVSITICLLYTSPSPRDS